MNKYFKPYLYSIYFLGVLTLIISFIQKNPFEVNPALIILTIFMIITEIKAISPSENVYFSLMGIFVIFALSLAPAFEVIISLIITLIFVDIIRVYYFKLYDKVFNIKLFFNLSMHIICLYLSYLISFNLIKIPLLSIIVGIIIYNIINSIIFSILIKLLEDKPFSIEMTKQSFILTYYFVLISLMLYYSYLAYQEIGLTVVLLFLVSYQSTSLNRNFKKEIEKNIFIDPLTDAANRTSLNNDIGDKLLNKTPFSIIFIDLDNFKDINDNYSHSTGDQVLIHFVNTIQKNIKQKLYRYGGDEFCILINKKENITEVIKSIDSLKDSLTINYDNKKINYSISYGIYNYLGEEMNIENIFDIASQTMHENKVNNKKNKI
ncbi:MAG: GGDEF domain-containing protein [Pleomorphochaeta sp.]